MVFCHLFALNDAVVLVRQSQTAGSGGIFLGVCLHGGVVPLELANVLVVTVAFVAAGAGAPAGGVALPHRLLVLVFRAVRQPARAFHVVIFRRAVRVGV